MSDNTTPLDKWLPWMSTVTHAQELFAPFVRTQGQAEGVRKNRRLVERLVAAEYCGSFRPNAGATLSHSSYFK
jgi:hypothetical protein